MNKHLVATFLVAAAAVEAAQTVWRFEATDGDGKQGGDAVGKSANKTPKTGDTTVLTLPGGEKMVLIYCAPGEFMMGSDRGESCEKPVHKVRLTYGFWMGKYEVTQKQWKSVMGTNPSARKGDYLPVDSVTRGDCDQFLRKIEAHSHGVRAWLPTEAQWEYACRAGTKGEYAGEIDLMGWYAGNSDNRPHPVGGLLPNAWGFCDMHGNVWELCNDLFGEDYYSKSPLNDPPGASMPSATVMRELHGKGVVIPRAYVLRGGCWYLDAKDCRSARRHAIGFGAVPEQLIGFRICCVLPGELVFVGNKML
jgi:formylglycine-generating enzyme required for sulfatase activity